MEDPKNVIGGEAPRSASDGPTRKSNRERMPTMPATDVKKGGK